MIIIPNNNDLLTVFLHLSFSIKLSIYIMLLKKPTIYIVHLKTVKTVKSTILQYCE